MPTDVADGAPSLPGAAAVEASRRRARDRTRSVARWFLTVHTIVLLVGGAAVFAALSLDAQSTAQAAAGETSRDLALALATEPTVVEVVARAHERADRERKAATAEASAILQPYVQQLLHATDVDYVTIMDTDRTRYTHPVETRIGGRFVGTIGPALEGETFTEVYTGTLGPSVRAVTPVRAEGEIVGLVSAGLTVGSVRETVLERMRLVGAITAVAVAVGAAAAVWLSRRLDRVTDGRAPDELARLFAAHEALLHGLEEGLLLVERDDDGAARVVLANDEALRAIGEGLEVPFAVDDGRVHETAREVLAGRNLDDLVRIEGQELLVSRTRTAVAGRHADILTLRDRTELKHLTGELSSVRTISDALRAQAHEFDNRLHTIATLIELGRSDEALGFAASERDLGQRLTDRVLGAIDEPVIAALVLGKAAQARERAVEMHFETHLAPGTQGLEPADVVTILGNLIDNAIDAAAARAARTRETDAWVEVYLASDADALIFQVTDSGDGIDDADRERIFDRGYSTKDVAALGRGYGLSLVRQVVQGLRGTIEVGEAPAGRGVHGHAAAPGSGADGGGMSDIRVLVVEDDARTADAHAAFVERVEGFALAGVAHTASEARRALRAAAETGGRIHLVLLDLTLPDGHGLALVRELRQARVPIDVIAVTAVRELEAVREAVAIGVVQYLIKPFVFGVFREKLLAYRSYFEHMRTPVESLSQREVDGAFAALRTSNAPGLPKGLSQVTLDGVSALLAETEGPLSASEVAEALGLSRVTARRYLEFLADGGVAVRSQRHGSVGRPELQYARR
ncbi:ATP-binding protein [Microbacterium sp. Marseille-Q6965]|uniref:ATP-binding protein n=1 Tax=Microbacterium sp. Marseille-Q6965 TaxID=2965072 RepID=UPI0028E0A337|nr:ATP-binding protein [Microbacterium sp. Marseille-Q6965]